MARAIASYRLAEAASGKQRSLLLARALRDAALAEEMSPTDRFTKDWLAQLRRERK